MGAADAFSDVLTQIPAGSSAAFSGILSQIPSSGGSNVGGGEVAHSPSIKNMQQAIIDLGKAMTGYKAFNDFLHSRYDGKFDIGAMEAVGNAGKADGAWGARTDAGLRSVVALADALDKMHSSMSLKIDGFDPSGLKGVVPESYRSLTDANGTADKLVEEIGKLSGVYGNIAHFMQQRYGNRLSDDADVIKYPGGLDRKESEYAQSNPNTVVLKLMDGTPVQLKDLASEQALQALFQRTYPGKKFDAKVQADWMLKQLEGANR